MNFRQLDLNLLRVLVAVYRSGSVTEAGRQLALSQPATSNALARLRAFFGDELFVRTPQGMQPTPVAERAVPAVMSCLQALEAELCGNVPFDPQTSDRHWRLSLSDLGEMMFLAPLAHALRREAPRSRMSNVAVPAAAVGAALASREIDLAVGILDPGRSGIASERLFQEHYVALTAPGWRPAGGSVAGTLSVAQLAQATLVTAAPTATFHDSVQQMLTALRLSDRVALRTRHYGALPHLVSGSDLLAIVPLMYARSLQPRYKLRIWELPRHGPPYEVRMLWHDSVGEDPGHQWLRGILRSLFKRPAASARTPRAAPR
ncbi:MAG: LysR family transcriptional regulator [Rubrivivax sp.]|nr:LysR family transcriptional regulator [Rubrivivax sp.]